MKTETPQTIFLKDYTPPLYLVEHIDLHVRIFAGKTLVTAKTKYKKNHKGSEDIVLNGERMKLLSVKIDGESVEYTVDDKFLTLTCPGEKFELETEVEIVPEENTSLEGLYQSGGTYCTQCEAEGFRKITYFPDRPDVMTTFTVWIEADKKSCPVLLSNGNLLKQGEIGEDRHFTVWHDPFPKPCYLFALVAGDLVDIRDSFTTMTGRIVDLRIYVRAGDETQCGYAMESLKRSMEWDESAYGREYQLDRFNIVAVSDFNMGAMENTSLNIFNTALVLAQPETATDLDFERVEGVIAHEYFHNWTGNRVTCRDWFQLSLKEGLTVFRDQEFTADMNSRGVKRIDDVIRLRKMQFPEDAGPMAHPIRPDNYIEISNFYTTTVYEKGAEVIRMQHTLLGPDQYRKATDLYFDKFDGQAVTCEDFVQCMEEASGIDLAQFRRWYNQAGTPEIHATSHYDEKSRRFTLTLKQHVPPTPGQTDKKPMHIPVSVGLVGPNGDDMVTRLLELKNSEAVFTFDDIAIRPVPSILRNFSAPVKLTTDLSDADYRFLMVHDSDGFNRWEAGQILSLRMLNRIIDGLEKGQAVKTDPAFLESFEALLEQGFNDEHDMALLARSIALPDLPIIAQQRNIVDPDMIQTARRQVLTDIAGAFRSRLENLYDRHYSPTTYAHDPVSTGQRALKNMALGYLTADYNEHGIALAKQQYDSANNMTDRVSALLCLSETGTNARKDAFADFYQRFKDYPLVVDKWFSIQAMAVRPDTLDDVLALREHPAFTILNPNRVRSLYAAFSMSNPVCFHARDGRGYDFLVDAVTTLNVKNPQIASRLLTPLREWRRYTPDRQEKMKAALEKIAALPNLSPDVFEIVSKTLKAA
ncbi:MAG: aminopeptidase N [Micavibrio sp.]